MAIMKDFVWLCMGFVCAQKTKSLNPDHHENQARGVGGLGGVGGGCSLIVLLSTKVFCKVKKNYSQ